MHFAEAVEAGETQLKANQRFQHTAKSYQRDIEMLRGWLEREGKALDVERIFPLMPFQFAALLA